MERDTQIRRLRSPVGGVSFLQSAAFLFIFLVIATCRIIAAAPHAGELTANPQISAAPSGQISGHVYRADSNAPLAKVVVTLYGRSDEDGSTSSSIATGPDGSFTFAGLPPGKYVLNAERCGFIQQMLSGLDANSVDGSVFISLSEGQKIDGFDFRMIQGGVISGVVTDEDGEPVPGLLVSALSYSYEAGGGRSENPSSAKTARTDDRGSFRVVELNPGTYYVKVEKESSRMVSSGSILYRETFYPNAFLVRDAQKIRVAPGGEASGINISVRLQHAYAIRGRVLGPCHGDERNFCQLTALVVDSPAREQPGRQGTDQDGSFLWPGLFSGEYQLTALAQHMNSGGSLGIGIVRVQLLDHDAEANIPVAPLAEVYGIAATDSSRPLNLQHLKMVLSPINLPDFGNSTAGVNSDDDSEDDALDSKGHFDITDIHPGKYIFSLEADDSRGEFRALRSRSDNDGAGNPDTLYLKEILCSGHDYARQPLDVVSGMRLGECKVKVAGDTGSISGAVTDGDKSVPGLIVVAIPESPELRQIPRYTLTAHTNRSGQFVIPGIIPGDYLLFAVAPNKEQDYYALDFADRNQGAAVRVTLKPNEAKTLTLKPTTPQ